MHRHVSLLFLSFLLFVLPIALPINYPDVYASSTDFDEIAQAQLDHTKVEGVVTQLKSGLYTIRTSTVANYAD